MRYGRHSSPEPIYRWAEPRPVVNARLAGAVAPYADLAKDLAEEGLIEIRAIAESKVSTGERAAIDAFLATKGARRYAFNDSADDFNLCIFLIGKGYKVQRNSALWNTWNARVPYRINEKPFSRKAFIAFVNKVRAQFNMQPIGVPA